MSDEAYALGYKAASIFDNPYWREYPKPSSKGQQDEINGRKFVDGYVDKLRDKKK